MTACPSCNGNGGGQGIACGPGFSRVGFLECHDCKGSGEVTEDFQRRYHIGRRMFAERVARSVSSREEAQRLGAGYAEWSRVEHGREPETEAGRMAWEKRLAELEA